MRAPIKFLLAGLAGLALSAVAAGAALAGGCGCSPPPPCCAPPTPPPPPSYPCCQPPGHTVNVPGVNVFVGASVVVNASASAQASANASANASASGSAGSTVFFGGGGGGGGGYAIPGAQGMVQGLDVEGAMLKRTAYEATRKITRRVVIQAACLDDKEVPHPASQTTPDREIDDAFEGELYRCIAGTHMQATIADYDGRIDFDHGRILACDKGQALYHAPGGAVDCRAQKPARDCNERSLLRRFGAGVKILAMITEERYTVYREETVRTGTATMMSLDGGVGGFMY
jgi:hypothetical protein